MKECYYWAWRVQDNIAIDINNVSILLCPKAAK